MAPLRWLCPNLGYITIRNLGRQMVYRRLMHHNSGYATLAGVDQDVFTSCCSEQPDPEIDLATHKAHVNEHWP